MARRNWGFATLIAGAVILLYALIPWQGAVGLLFFIKFSDPAAQASPFWWLGALAVVVGLSLVIVGIALLASYSMSQKKALS